MAKKQEIITIDLDLNNLTASIDVEGLDGPLCLEATKALEAALGEVTERTHKPEFNKRARGVQHTRTRRTLNQHR